MNALPSPSEIALRDARRLARTLEDLVATGRRIGPGYAACDAPGSWARYAAGVGAEGEVAAADLDALVAVYTERGAVPRVQLSPYEHPSLLAGLGQRGFVAYEQVTLLGRALDDLPAAPSVPGLVLRRLDPSQPDEVDAFVAVQLEGFYGPEPAPEAMGPITRRVATHPRTRLWLAELDGEVVGSAGVEWFEGSAALIAGAVVPAARRRGVHAALIHRRLVDARDLGAAYVLIGSDPGAATERNALRTGFGVVTTLLGVRQPRAPAGA